MQPNEKNTKENICAMWKKIIKTTKHQWKIPVYYVKFKHQLSFRNMNLKLDHNTAGKWFIHNKYNGPVWNAFALLFKNNAYINKLIYLFNYIAVFFTLMRFVLFQIGFSWP